jgi:hypothetical protein
MLARLPHGAKHDAFDVLALQERERARFQFGIVLDIKEHDRVFVLPGAERDLLSDAREEWIRDIRDDQAHLERLFEPQTPGQLIGDKIYFLGDFPDGGLRLLADAIAISLAA